MRRIHTMAEDVKKKANIDVKKPFKSLVRLLTSTQLMKMSQILEHKG